MSKKMQKKAEAKKTEKAEPAEIKPEGKEESSDSEIDMPVFTPELAKLKDTEMGE